MDSSYQPSPHPPQHLQHPQHPAQAHAISSLIQAATTALRNESTMDPTTGPSTGPLPPPMPYTPDFAQQYPTDLNFIPIPRHIINSFVQQQQPHLQPSSPQPSHMSPHHLQRGGSSPSSTGRTWDPTEADRPIAEKFVEQNAVFCKACKKYRQFRKDQANIGNRHKSRRFRCCSCMSNYLRVADIMASIRALQDRTRKRDDEEELDVGEEDEDGRRKRIRIKRALGEEDEGLFVKYPSNNMSGFGPAPTERTQENGQFPGEQTQMNGVPPQRMQSQSAQHQSTPPTPPSLTDDSIEATMMAAQQGMMSAQSTMSNLMMLLEGLRAENKALKSENAELKETVNKLEQHQEIQRNLAASMPFNTGSETPGLQQGQGQQDSPSQSRAPSQAEHSESSAAPTSTQQAPTEPTGGNDERPKEELKGASVASATAEAAENGSL